MTITTEQIAALATSGSSFWWLRADGTTYATAEFTPETSSDSYLLRASEQWTAQWDGDWQAAADQINQAISRQEGS